jgi:hypothetical protein
MKPERLAVEGEELVAHRFRTGLVRMVSRSDYRRWMMVAETCGLDGREAIASPPNPLLRWYRNVWWALVTFFHWISEALLMSDGEPGPVVAFPSDALVRVYGISPDMREQYHLNSMEDALFLEVSPLIGHSRDALCFGNGVVVTLQSLREGQRVKILYRSWMESMEPDPEPVYAGM